jgi:hypothetical protein
MNIQRDVRPPIKQRKSDGSKRGGSDYARLPRRPAIHPQAGDWQGTLKFGKNEIRVVVTIAKGANGGWTASEVTPDEGSNPVLASFRHFRRFHSEKSPSTHSGQL